MPISSPNPMFDHLLESRHRDDSNKWSNIGFIEEIMQAVSIEVNFLTPYLELWSKTNPSVSYSAAKMLLKITGV